MSPFNKKYLSIMLIAVVLLAAFSAIAYAQSSGTVDEDASNYASSPTLTTNDDRLRVEAGTPNCAASVTRFSYVKWDLNDVAGPIASAEMSFSVQSTNIGSAVAGAQNLVLYRTTDEWTETTLNWSNKPPLGEVVQSIVMPTAAGSVVTFNAPALAAYLQQEADGDNVASFALGLTGNCGESSVVIRLYSKDQTVAPKPDLQVLKPTAVDMSSTSAETVTWPLYAGLGAVALVVIAGLAVSRRRTA